jgi:TDG/mug DNA glycosylase family protein
MDFVLTIPFIRLVVFRHFPADSFCSRRSYSQMLRKVQPAPTCKTPDTSLGSMSRCHCILTIVLPTPDQYDFPTLPDHLRPGLDLVFIGINPGLYSVSRGHYFARTTSRFWPAFSRSKLSKPMRRELSLDTLLPEHDSELPRFGIGLTDVVKRPSGNASELDRSDFAKWIPILLEKLHRYAPRVACFHGLTGYRPFRQVAFPSAGIAPVLGEQPERSGTTRLYVVPNPSPANAHFTLADQIAWYDRLNDFLKTTF